MKINLHIERVVLDGLPADHGRDLRAALCHGLATQLKEGGLAPELRAGGALPTLTGGEVRFERQAKPGRLGEQIAGAVYRGIGAKR